MNRRTKRYGEADRQKGWQREGREVNRGVERFVKFV